MSNTHKHKGKGYWKNGIEDKNNTSIRKYLNHCRRNNEERGKRKPLLLNIKEKMADTEMQQELAEHIPICSFCKKEKVAEEGMLCNQCLVDIQNC